MPRLSRKMLRGGRITLPIEYFGGDSGRYTGDEGATNQTCNSGECDRLGLTVTETEGGLHTQSGGRRRSRSSRRPRRPRRSKRPRRSSRRSRRSPRRSRRSRRSRK